MMNLPFKRVKWGRCADLGMAGSQDQCGRANRGTIHAKYAVFDRRISIVGSYNMDPRSRTLNSESAIVFENEDLSRQLADMFYRNDIEFSRQITLEEAKSFAESTDTVYKLQEELGILFKDSL
jgi:phosphatidylserine/phosphatidylglycerophosphate/cardiolipin synthase-like enzyme